MPYSMRIAALRAAAIKAEALAKALQAAPIGASIIGALVRHGDLVLVQGGPADGAGLVALSMATHLAGRADAWAGHLISFSRDARTSWIDARSDVAIGATTRAIEQHHKLDLGRRFEIERLKVLLGYQPSVVSLLVSVKGQTAAPPRALFLDDLPAATQGLDQGRAEDAGRIAEALRTTIQEGLGGCPIVVTDGLKGPLTKAADVVMTVARAGRFITVTTAGRRIPEMRFELRALRGAVIAAPVATNLVSQK